MTFFIYLAGLLFTFIYSAPELGRTKVARHAGQLHHRDPARHPAQGGGLGDGGATSGSTEPWYIGLVIGLFLLGAASTKDFADIEGDRAGGCRTLPIVYGVKKAAWIISPFFVLPWLLLPLGAVLRDPQNPSHPILTGNPGS